jgi:2-amino-4-hydroxy-6-hydroxymethyldihydropteridine diphosphokinase
LYDRDQCEQDQQSLAFISVGSNIHPEHTIPAALSTLSQSVRVTASSTFYQTKPIGPAGQPDYVNGIWQIDTTLTPDTIKSTLLLPIETQLGRVRSADKYAPRPIDLDLILYDDLCMDNAVLQLPHPDIDRPFVHIPIRELLLTATTQPEITQKMLCLLPKYSHADNPGHVLDGLTRRLQQLIIKLG